MTHRTLLLSLAILSMPVALQAQQLPYQNPSLSAHERAVDLCSRLTLEEKAQLMLDDSPAIPRLGIKRFQWWSEALHGVANMGDVTVFPEPIGISPNFAFELARPFITSFNVPSPPTLNIVTFSSSLNFLAMFIASYFFVV